MKGWLLLRAFVALLFAAAALPVTAQSLESVLRPGELIQGHAKWDDDCGACHVRFDPAAQRQRCLDCHKDVAKDIAAKGGYHGRQSNTVCRTCHTDHRGRNARIVVLDTTSFDHRQTDYALKGKHEKVECDKCHVSGKKYREAPQTCDACHADDDVHKGTLGKTCTDCHSETDWHKTTFDHAKTKFPLSGKHVDAKCDACHKSKVYEEAETACVACHRKDDDGEKGHRGRNGEKCDNCHNAKAWKPSIFEHDRQTKFALRGKHRDVACTDCHKGFIYKEKTPTACVECHTKDDKHKGSLGKNCDACHIEKSWKDTGHFDHDKTRFALVGKHGDVKCADCHKKPGVYTVDDRSCVACHREDDKHKGSLGTDCEACHVALGWKDLKRFDHEKSRFPLRGGHVDAKCDACHKDADYRKTPSECIACHRDDDKHEGTLGKACSDCHDERDWKRAVRFDHEHTKFPLRNAHARTEKVKCADCHADPRHYRDIPRDCIACHRKDDKHEGQIGERCDACHRDTEWKDVSFDHGKARFPLVGSHQVVKCDECHKSRRYRDAPRTCDGCHAKDDHHKGRLGAACETCHNARSWKLWSFDHEREAQFRLDGAHAPLACEKCHVDPAPKGKKIAGIDRTCIFCHRKDDRHDGGFGGRCERCHTTSKWSEILRGNYRPKASTGATSDATDMGRSSWFARRPASERPPI